MHELVSGTCVECKRSFHNKPGSPLQGENLFCGDRCIRRCFAKARNPATGRYKAGRWLVCLACGTQYCTSSDGNHYHSNECRFKESLKRGLWLKCQCCKVYFHKETDPADTSRSRDPQGSVRTKKHWYCSQQCLAKRTPKSAKKGSTADRGM